MRNRLFYAIAAIASAAVIFTLLFSAYARRFDRTMMQENCAQLEEVSKHVAAYMERAVEQQWRELHVAAAASQSILDKEERIAYLGNMAKKLQFEYIGLAGEDGLLYAEAFQNPIDISKEDYFLSARDKTPYMTGLRRHIFKDRAVSGVIFALPASDETGAIIIAMFSTKELGEDMQADSFNGNGYSFIIDAEGEQILHARSMAYNNLFLALQNLKFEDGYSLEAMRADIANHKTGMTAYSDLGVEKYAYYRPLSFNGWTVVSIVPKGVITARTASLSRELILMCVAATFVFLGLLSAVGVLLMRLESRRQANAAKSDFLANMSHDMRTPMNAIMGMSEIAGIHADEPDTVRDCMRKIGLSSRHLLGLINDILDMSRIESGKMYLSREPFSLAEMLEGVGAMTYPQIHAKGQHFAVRLHRVEHEYFLGDSLRLSQVFVNILTNAMKFTPENGRITVDIEELPPKEAKTAQFRFTFTDNGIGMKPEFLKDLFSPFSREQNSRVDRTEGSGLGMAITKRILDLMGGEITVKSAEGKGSAFTVNLALTLNSEIQDMPSLPNWRILLAGGKEEQGQEIVRTLKSMGQSAHWTPDVEAALECMAGESFQAVILDRSIYTPENTAFLRNADRACVLFLSAYDWEDIQEEAIRAGIQFFIQKPLLRGTLTRAFQKSANMEQGEKSVAPRKIDFTGKRILLAEDNDLNFEIVRTLLSETGASILRACDGQECISIFEDSPVDSLHLILMDIQMPRMNGIEATARIRALKRADASIPILAMSANAYAEDREAAAKAGMNGYLTKPIDMDVWVEELGKYE